MPIKVIRIESGYKSKNTKVTPGLHLRKSMHSNKVEGMWIQEHSIEFFGKGFKTASEVYVTSEINAKFSNINTQINLVKKEFESEISKSLDNIQKDLIAIKKEMIKDKVFLDNITQSLINNKDFVAAISDKIGSVIQSEEE